MKSPIKMSIALLLALFLLIPNVSFAKEKKPTHIRIPITLVSTGSQSNTNGSSPDSNTKLSPNLESNSATELNGYLDFWSTVSGDNVTAH